MSAAEGPVNPHHERRWAILAMLGIAQLMVILDATIVNIALPSAQKALGFSNDNRQWIVTAYALAFGSLLLLGGRLGDLFGRKWTFVVGLLGFASPPPSAARRRSSACWWPHAPRRAPSVRCSRRRRYRC
jgi:MFS family permease